VTADVVKLSPPDPIFALVPELRLHASGLDGRLVVNSREVSRVFGRRHHRLLRGIMEQIWHAPMRPDRANLFRLRADGTIDMTSDGLSRIVCGPRWGKRGKQFMFDWIDLVSKVAREHEAKTGVNPITEGIKKFFPGVRWRTFTADGRPCCDDCQQPLPAGPALHDELWTSIAQPDAFLCFDCIEKRLGRPLTQADLTVCAFNAGWISFDGADVAALQFARGRRLLPPGEVAP
jgi:hypothetical protein